MGVWAEPAAADADARALEGPPPAPADAPSPPVDEAAAAAQLAAKLTLGPGEAAYLSRRLTMRLSTVSRSGVCGRTTGQFCVRVIPISLPNCLKGGFAAERAHFPDYR